MPQSTDRRKHIFHLFTIYFFFSPSSTPAPAVCHSFSVIISPFILSFYSFIAFCFVPECGDTFDATLNDINSMCFAVF